MDGVWVSDIDHLLKAPMALVSSQFHPHFTLVGCAVVPGETIRTPIKKRPDEAQCQ